MGVEGAFEAIAGDVGDGNGGVGVGVVGGIIEAIVGVGHLGGADIVAYPSFAGVGGGGDGVDVIDGDGKVWGGDGELSIGGFLVGGLDLGAGEAEFGFGEGFLFDIAIDGTGVGGGMEGVGGMGERGDVGGVVAVASGEGGEDCEGEEFGVHGYCILDRLEAVLVDPFMEASAFFVGDGVFGVIGEADAVWG